MIDPSTKVSEILKRKLGRITRAPLEVGSPSWNEIQEMTWGEIEEGAHQNLPGYRTIRKLLTAKEYDK